MRRAVHVAQEVGQPGHWVLVGGCPPESAAPYELVHTTHVEAAGALTARLAKGPRTSGIPIAAGTHRVAYRGRCVPDRAQRYSALSTSVVTTRNKQPRPRIRGKSSMNGNRPNQRPRAAPGPPQHPTPPGMTPGNSQDRPGPGSVIAKGGRSVCQSPGPRAPWRRPGRRNR